IAANRFAGFFFLALSLAGLMSLFVREGFTIYGEQLRAGGLAGYGIIIFLLTYFNTAGTYIILFLIFIVSLIFTVEFSLVSTSQRLCQLAAALLTAGKNRLASFFNFASKDTKIDRSPQPVFGENLSVT